MLRLSEHNRVLFAEFDGHIIEQLKKGIFLDWMKGIRKINNNFHVITPPPAMPFRCTVPFFNSISQFNNLVFYRHIIKKMGFNDPILWITRPTQLGAIGRLGEKLLVYDCVDEHSGFHSIMQNNLVSRQRQVMFAMEKIVLSRADIVFTTARRLYSNKKEYNRNTYLVPNACDSAHFSRALSKDTEIPAGMKPIKHPIIGFYGLLDRNKINIGLIMDTALKYPEYSVVLVGPKNINTKKLESIKNIFLLGEVPYGQLPNYLKGFDAAIIPFKHNDAIENTNPVKLYEYLAAGRPVVCTDFPEARAFKDVLRIAGEDSEFVDLIPAALNENSEELVNKRLAAVKEHSWDNRTETISGLLEEALRRKTSQK